jgi:G3E family GTPase
MEKVPVIIITGFLGSGKTTLVNHVLQANHGRRIAVVVNEFGEVGVDGALIANHAEAGSVVEMNNGCLCCTFRGDFSKGLFDLLEKRERGEINFDTILVEASGMADPVPLIQTLEIDPEVTAAFTLSNIVALVDVKYFLAQARMLPVASEQLALADTIVLNKLDLVTPEELHGVKQWIGFTNDRARVVETTRGNISVADIFDTQVRSIDRALQIAARPTKGFGESHAGVDTMTLRLTEEYTEAAFRTWLDRVLDIYEPDMLRYKGFVQFQGALGWYLVQGVHTLYEITPVVPPVSITQSTLVFIGRGIVELKESL